MNVTITLSTNDGKLTMGQLQQVMTSMQEGLDVAADQVLVDVEYSKGIVFTFPSPQPGPEPF